ncbi:alanine racemase [Amycolatopsis acidiphila]|uniref:Alanine racemase n=1 Tax=Amycolatopsis acidiphila TaxID=715473 RepID=A0A557ZRJ3_9PSEU|nr:alanine racemase [Amycolatopsis acidiphila]TVT14639.1 alanine racemase [Amycolatopsis acidiphila]UIJ60742.1 alanine racemase [Amycolatopsis acidiphila]GHG91091.1 alanine racemase [Amycolatopsis acidiphila]
MSPESFRTEVVIDLAAIRHNVRLLAERPAHAATMAVVKADGYGHGAVPVARAALDGGATWLGACSLAEGLALREAGITAPVFTWLDAPDVDFTPGITADIDLSASSADELARVADAAHRAGKRARVHLKIDTGLSRSGAPAYAWPTLVKAAAAEPGIEVVAIWSHLACADEPGHTSIDQQAQRFQTAYDIAREAGLNPLRHIANSAATLTRPDLHFDLVRPGIAIYGLNPVPQQEDLRPAMTFRAQVVLTKRIEAGESVSYGQTWTAARDTTLALVPAGYADGVPRTLSGRMEVWLGGRRRPVVGRVCMDQLVVDCGDDEPAVGSEVVLFGAGANGEPTAREWADTIGTIDYEIVTGMYRPRVRRRYEGE